MRKLYLWTITTSEAEDVLKVRKMWHVAQSGKGTGLIYAFPNLSGLRVFEMHPGGHGLHIHFIVNQRLPVDIVRAITTRAGFGRIHVKEIPGKHAMYLGKYLRKSERPQCLSGCRLWAAFGQTDSVKVKDVVIENDFSNAYRFIKSVIVGWDELEFRQRMQFVKEFIGGMTLEQSLESIGFTEGSHEHHKVLAKAEALMKRKDENEKQRKIVLNQPLKPLRQSAADEKRRNALYVAGILVKDKRSETGYRYRDRKNEPF